MDSQQNSFGPEVPQPVRDEQYVDAVWAEADADDPRRSSPGLRGVREASREDVAY